MVLDKVMVVYVRDPIEHARQACSVKNNFLLQTPSERPCRKSSSDTAYELRLCWPSWAGIATGSTWCDQISLRRLATSRILSEIWSVATWEVKVGKAMERRTSMLDRAKWVIVTRRCRRVWDYLWGLERMLVAENESYMNRLTGTRRPTKGVQESEF